MKKINNYLDDPVCLPEVPELAEPVVDLVHLDADHVPEPSQVLTRGDEGVLLPRHVLKVDKIDQA